MDKIKNSIKIDMELKSSFHNHKYFEMIVLPILWNVLLMLWLITMVFGIAIYLVDDRQIYGHIHHTTP